MLYSNSQPAGLFPYFRYLSILSSSTFTSYILGRQQPALLVPWRRRGASTTYTLRVLELPFTSSAPMKNLQVTTRCHISLKLGSILHLVSILDFCYHNNNNNNCSIPTSQPPLQATHNFLGIIENFLSISCRKQSTAPKPAVFD
jgi:hypothetical protein